MNNFSKLTLLVLLVVVIIFSVWYFDLDQKLEAENIKEFVDDQGILAPVIFIFLYIVSVLLFFPATPLTLLAGILFGTWKGFAYVIFAAMCVSMIAFSISRYFGKNFFEKKVENKFDQIIKGLKNNEFKFVFFFRLIPLFHFNTSNLAFGATKIKKKNFFWGTLLGIIPGTIIVIYFGNSLGNLDLKQLIISGSILIVSLILVLIVRYFGKKIKFMKDMLISDEDNGKIN